MLLIEGQFAAFDVQARQSLRRSLFLGRQFGEQMAVAVEAQPNASSLELNLVGRLIAQQAQGGYVGRHIVDAQPGFVWLAVFVSLDAAHAAVADQADLSTLDLDATAEHVLQALGDLLGGPLGRQVEAEGEEARRHKHQQDKGGNPQRFAQPGSTLHVGLRRRCILVRVNRALTDNQANGVPSLVELRNHFV